MGSYLNSTSSLSDSSDMYPYRVDSGRMKLNKLFKLNDRVFHLIYIINFIKSVCLLFTVLS